MLDKKAVIILLVVGIFISSCEATELAIQLEGRDEHCFYEGLGEMILIRMSVLCNQGEYLEFTVSESKGRYQHKESGKNAISFNIVTEFDGYYKFCFHNTDFRNEITVYFDYKTGAEAKDYSDLISKEEGVKFNLSANRLEDVLHDIGVEKKLIIRHQQYNSALSNDLSFKIQGFSIITGILLLCLGIFQSYYLRQFFKDKKMI